MAKKSLPCPTLLRQLFRYDPDTGALFWKRRERWMFDTDKGYAIWNGKNAGQEAFTTVGTSGYREGRIFRKLERAHRVVVALAFGFWPIDEVDHANGDKCDNRIDNLRLVGRVENARNLKLRSDNTSGCMGVGYRKSRGKWDARITVDGRTISLGYHDSKEDAIRARKQAERKYNFGPTHGRAG